MKEILDQESRNALVSYRLERAYKSLEEALYLSEGGYYNAAVNRLYYACYYAAVALLLKNGISAQTHSGVKTMLGLHFVSKGKLPISTSNIFATLFEKRHSGDYDDFIYCDQKMVDTLYPEAKTFIEQVKELIENTEDNSKQDI